MFLFNRNNFTFMQIQRVLLKVNIDKVIMTVVKQKRNRISPEITERPAFLNRTAFSASTAYTSGFIFAKVFSHRESSQSDILLRWEKEYDIEETAEDAYDPRMTDPAQK